MHQLIEDLLSSSQLITDEIIDSFIQNTSEYKDIQWTDSNYVNIYQYIHLKSFQDTVISLLSFFTPAQYKSFFSSYHQYSSITKETLNIYIMIYFCEMIATKFYDYPFTSFLNCHYLFFSEPFQLYVNESHYYYLLTTTMNLFSNHV